MSAAPAATDRVAFAVAAILVSAFAHSAGSAIVALANTRFPVWQLYVLRSLLVVPALVVLLHRADPGGSLMPRRVGWVALRSALLVGMWVAYYAALSEIELSLAAAIYHTSPLLIVPLSAALAGERVGWTVRAGAAIGFAGVLVILRPDAGPIDGHAVLPFVAAALNAAAMVLTRVRCADESPLGLALALNLALGAAGLAGAAACAALPVPGELEAANPFLFGEWRALGAREWTVLGALAVTMVVGSVGAAYAYQNAPSPIVATFDYAYLVFAGLWAMLLFGAFPDPAAWTGMALIAAGGALAMRRGRAGPRPGPAGPLACAPVR